MIADEVDGISYFAKYCPIPFLKFSTLGQEELEARSLFFSKLSARVLSYCLWMDVGYPQEIYAQHIVLDVAIYAQLSGLQRNDRF